MLALVLAAVLLVESSSKQKLVDELKDAQRDVKVQKRIVQAKLDSLTAKLANLQPEDFRQLAEVQLEIKHAASEKKSLTQALEELNDAITDSAASSPIEVPDDVLPTTTGESVARELIRETPAPERSIPEVARAPSTISGPAPPAITRQVSPWDSRSIDQHLQQQQQPQYLQQQYQQQYAQQHQQQYLQQQYEQQYAQQQQQQLLAQQYLMHRYQYLQDRQQPYLHHEAPREHRYKTHHHLAGNSWSILIQGAVMVAVLGGLAGFWFSRVTH